MYILSLAGYKKPRGIKGYNTIMNRSVWMKSSRYRECLLEIAMLCEDTMVDSFISSIDDMMDITKEG